MKKEEASGNDFSITDKLRSYIKVFNSELKIRLLGVSNKSWGIVVFEKGIVTEVMA